MSGEELIKEVAADVEALTRPSLDKFKHLQITDRTDIPQPQPVITIHGETISTAGNITTISGPPKSGKTAAVSVIEAGAISTTGVIDGIEGIHVLPNVNKKAVLHFDTEQARHKHQYNVFTILTRAGYDTCPDYYLSYNIRELDVKEYAPTTAEICKNASELHGGVHLIVIDGLADYIRDVNEPDQSNAVIKWAEQLAIDHSCPVILIIHTNPNSDKERGHLGSQAQRKSESVIQIKTEGDISFIEPRFLRNAGKGNVPLIQFMYDRDKGYHVGCGIRSQDNTAKDQQRIAATRETCAEAFGQNAFTYSDAITAIMRCSKKGERSSKDMFKEMKAHEMITQTDNLWRLSI